jgi:UDP-2,3-diacylglucosamine pyrophosphatase LpxH
MTMSISTPPTLVIGDLHLCSVDNHGGAAALERLLADHPDWPIVFNGDTLDLAAESTRNGAEAVHRCLDPFPALVARLRERAERGVRLQFLAGNHDAAIATAEATEALHLALGLSESARRHVTTSPWFTLLANGRIHVEHGHAFEPDGAPSHPLSPSPRDDVGIIVMRDFVVPVGAHSLVHSHDEPPLRQLMRLFRKYRRRAPWIMARYVRVASRTVMQSGRRFPLALDRRHGDDRLEAFGERVGVSTKTLNAMRAEHATPTRARAMNTLLRLYLDRVAATSALVSGTAIALTSAWFAPQVAAAGVAGATVGGLALATSLAFGVDRYGGRSRRMLAEGAERLAAITDVERVIFGHVHVIDEGPRYSNTSSFAFPCDPRGRSYLLVADDGTITRGFV